MRFVALEREVEGVNWEGKDGLLREEAAHVLAMKEAGVVEEIYFTEAHTAILFLQGEDLDSIKNLLADFPLVVVGMIRFETHALMRYDGFDRLANLE